MGLTTATEPRLRISRGQFKNLLTTYAADQSQTAKSQLSDSRGDNTGSCRLTIAAIVKRTPARFRIRGVSVLDKWCESRRRDAEILDELTEARSLARSSLKIDAIRRYETQAKDLDRAHRIAIEQTWGWERHELFDPALTWAAADLERRLEAVSKRELVVWVTVVSARS